MRAKCKASNRPPQLSASFLFTPLLTDPRGCPVAVSVHDGNTSDCETFLPQLQRLRQNFGIEQRVIVGDRGMSDTVWYDGVAEVAQRFKAGVVLPH